MRTDIHRPSAIKPEEYEFVAFNYIGSSDLGALFALKQQKEIFWAHMKQTGGKFSGHEHGGTCFVCGAFACYLIIKLENGSKVYGNRFENLDRGDKVKFVATVEASKDDPKFGYYKRPRIVKQEVAQ